MVVHCVVEIAIQTSNWRCTTVTVREAIVLSNLTANEARVIGCLMEKSIVTPDQYPLTLNACRACRSGTGRRRRGEPSKADGSACRQGSTSRTHEDVGYGTRVVRAYQVASDTPMR